MIYCFLFKKSQTHLPNVSIVITKILSYLISATVILISLSSCDNKTKNTQLKAADAITIINPRIRALPPGLKVTAMYMQLKNTSAIDHDLVKIEGAISDVIELHTHTNNNGVMQMGQVESIPIPANTTAEAKPGSYHVMIMGLKQDLKLGEKVDFNLIFKDGSNKSITAEVKKLEVH